MIATENVKQINIMFLINKKYNLFVIQLFFVTFIASNKD